MQPPLRFRGYRWVILGVIMLASFIAYTLRTNVSIVSETMMTDLGMSEYQLGLVFSAFAAGYTIFQFPGGLLGDRFGPRRTIAVIAIVWSLLTVVTALIPGADFWPVAWTVGALAFTRFLVGVASAPFFPVTIGGTIERWFPASQWGLPNGLTSTGLTLGAAATAPVVAWLMQMYGWRSALLIVAPTGLIAALAYWVFVRDDPADHPKVSPAELAYIRSERPPAEHDIKKGTWKLVLRDRNVLLISLSYFFINYVFFLFFNWFFFYLVNVREFTATDAGLFTAAQWILGAVGATVGGFACDALVTKFGMRRGIRLLSITAAVLSGLFLYIGATSSHVMLTVIALCFSFGITQLTEAPMWVATMSVAGTHSQAATGVLNTAGNAPGAIGGLMVPFIAGLFGWRAAIVSGCLFAIASAVLWFFIRADEPMAEGLDPSNASAPG